MKEPIRWRDDPALAADVRAVLQRLPKARPLDSTTRARMGRRLGRYLALPLVLTSWLTMKTAAASLALTVGAVGLGAVVVREVSGVDLPLAARPNRMAQKESKRRPSLKPLALGEDSAQAPGVPPSERSVAAFPDQEISELEPAPAAVPSMPALHEGQVGADLLPAATRPTPATERFAVGSVIQSAESKPPPHPHAVAATASRASAASSGRGYRPEVSPSPLGSEAPKEDLRAEAAMLELARRALASSPAEALAITEEHRARFPKAALGLEREFIRVEALRRLGRKSEARTLAQSLRQRGGLYTERVDRLIEQIDGAGE